MEYLHTMVRVKDLDKSLSFYCDKLGLKEMRRFESEQGRFTLVYLAAPGDETRASSEAESPMMELTHNWDPEDYDGGRNFGQSTISMRFANVFTMGA
jgi:lactoylglutathione lyase